LRDSPYFWELVAVGALASVAELFLMLWAARARRVRPGAPSAICGEIPLWSVVAALVVALLVPIFVVVLVSKGRDDLIRVALGLRYFRNAGMEPHWSQERVLSLGTAVGLTPLLLAGVFAGAVASWRARGRLQKILCCSAAPAMLVPFLIGVGLYPYRLLSIEIPNASVFTAREQAPYWTRALASGKQGLDVGALVAGCVLAVVFAWIAIWLVRKKDDSAHEWPRKGTAVLASAVMLAAGALACWLAAPLAAENRTAFPAHDFRFTMRVFPAVAPGLSQGELYDLSAKARQDIYWDRLQFPLSARTEDPLLRWGPVVEPRSDGIMIDYRRMSSPRELRETLDQKEDNLRLLHGDDTGSTLLMAPPDLPINLVADVLAVCYERGEREVRLVTGLPETIQRPLVGPLTRIIFQTTSVTLARDKDLDPNRRQRVLALSKGPRRYRDLLDEVFQLRPTSPVTLLLDPTGSWHYGSSQGSAPLEGVVAPKK
jgi:cytochrome bd-type quinol oxidase subunit 2